MFLESKQIIATVLMHAQKMQNKTFNTSVHDTRMTSTDPNVPSLPFCGGTINTDMLLPISFRIMCSKASEKARTTLLCRGQRVQLY